MFRTTKCLVTHRTFVWFLSTVKFGMSNKASSPCKLFAANNAFKRFLSWMTSYVCFEVMTTLTIIAAFCALVFTSMNIHMLPQAMPRWKMFLTLSTWIQFFFSVSPCSLTQNLLLCKPFVTHCIQIRPWLVIMWMLSDIITIIFSLNNSKRSFTCTICTALSTTFTDSNTLYNVH